MHATAVPGESVAARGVDGFHKGSGLPLLPAVPARRNTEPCKLGRPPPGLGEVDHGGRCFQRRESDVGYGLGFRGLESRVAVKLLVFQHFRWKALRSRLSRVAPAPGHELLS